MKNIVTFETAVRLKIAGFPQPTPEAGQFWWLKFMGEPMRPCVVNFAGTVEIYFSVVGGVVSEKKHMGHSLITNVWEKSGAVFAPTAADILAELFKPEIRGQIGAMDVLAMALNPELAAKDWLESNET